MTLFLFKIIHPSSTSQPIYLSIWKSLKEYLSSCQCQLPLIGIFKFSLLLYIVYIIIVYYWLFFKINKYFFCNKKCIVDPWKMLGSTDPLPDNTPLKIHVYLLTSPKLKLFLRTHEGIGCRTPADTKLCRRSDTL